LARSFLGERQEILKRRGCPRDEIEQLVFRNPIAFFGQSNGWTFKR
jgi:hypothetical protein